MFKPSVLLMAAAGLASSAPVADTSPASPAREPGAVAVSRADVVAELNSARTNPAVYAMKARARRALFRGHRIERPGEPAMITLEGPAAVDEAVAFLDRQAPLPPLRRHPALERAASDHAADQSRSGAIGHTGGDGSSPSERMRRRGRWSAAGETIAYGPHRAEDVILQLIVDDGVPDRGHRRILFNPTYELIGVACAPHPAWRRVCVLDFAATS